VANLSEIQAVLPEDAALVTWVDLNPWGPGAADPDGEHWGVVVRARGIPAWVALEGTGPGGLWSQDDTDLPKKVQASLRSRPGVGSTDLRPMLAKLGAQRIEPLAKALGAAEDSLPAARRLIVLPSRALAGIPIEALLNATDTRAVSYAPSGSVFRYLREQPHPDRNAPLLALGDPIFGPQVKPRDSEPPDHGLLINVALRGANAASHGLKDGDVLLSYNGRKLTNIDDLKVVASGDKYIPVEVWSERHVSAMQLAPGKLGVVFNPQPAPIAIAVERKLKRALMTARSGDEDLAGLPGTRAEVEAIAGLFESDRRPVRALLGADASEPALEKLASANKLAQFAFIHLATHGVINEMIPERSAVILTQTGLPDPLEQVMNHKPVFDGKLSVREIQEAWNLKAEMVTLSACETALGRAAGGDGFVGFTQALLLSGARSVCLSLWKVDDKATSLLMTRFYRNLLGKRAGMSKGMPKAESLDEAKRWLRTLTIDQLNGDLASVTRGDVRPLASGNNPPLATSAASIQPGLRPYEHPYFWAAFVLVGDPD
jgi:hypothetical protein